jgi:hypothetical protein
MLTSFVSKNNGNSYPYRVTVNRSISTRIDLLLLRIIRDIAQSVPRSDIGGGVAIDGRM